MMNYEIFKGIVQEKILNYMGPEYANAIVDIETVQKVNQQMDALIIRNQDDKISVSLYVNEMYKQYLKSEDLQEVMMDAVRVYKEAMENKPVQYEQLDFEGIRENVVFSLVNTEQNKELLENVMHREFQDMSIIYRWIINTEKEGIASTMITNRLAENVGISEQELYELAMENTPRILPIKVVPLQDMIMDMFCRDSGMSREEVEQMGFATFGDPSENDTVWVVSNEQGINGASSILLKDEMAKVAERAGSDLYLLPSSVHEMLAVSTSFGEPEMFAEMVQDVNMTTVSLEERLSNNVYLYDRDTRSISMATDVPNRAIGDVVAEEPMHYEDGPIR